MAFISSRPDPKAPSTAPPPRPQVYVQTIGRGGDARRVTDLKEGASGFSWSPDGKLLAVVSPVVPADTPDRAAAEKSDLKRYAHSSYKSDGSGYADRRRDHIFIVELATAAARQITFGDERDDGVPAWSPDGTRLVFVAAPTDDDAESRQDVWVVPAAGGALTRISDVPYRIGSPTWSPDGARIAYVGAVDHHIPRIRLAPAGGGASTVVAEPFTFPTSLSWAPDGRSLYAHANVKGEAHLFRVDLASQQVTPVTSGARLVVQPDVNAAAGLIAYVASDSTHPGEVYVADLTGAHERRLTGVNDALLAQLQLAPVERLTYKGADGWPIDGFFMRPVGWRAGERYPLVLAIHGGPNGMFGVGWSKDFQAMAAHGYAVFFANPRGSSGYGAAFQRAVATEWGGKPYVDLMNGVDAILAKYDWLDPQRLAVTGQSYGGFMTDWIVGHTTRFAAAVTLSGISDLVSVEGTRDGFYGHAADFGGSLFERFDEVPGTRRRSSTPRWSGRPRSCSTATPTSACPCSRGKSGSGRCGTSACRPSWSSSPASRTRCGGRRATRCR